MSAFLLQETMHRLTLNNNARREIMTSTLAMPASRLASSLGSIRILPTTTTTKTAAAGEAPEWCQGLCRRSRSRHLHRRWNTSQSSSTTAAAATAAAAAASKQDIATATAQLELLPPTSEQLRILAFRSAIPMVGFGIMDNVVMITAGEAIDSTFGVCLGISTMAAAGFGQCISDVAGITSGGLVDAGVSKLNLRHHGLSPKQLDSKISRIYSTFGACVGVLTGCLLGMTVLLL